MKQDIVWVSPLASDKFLEYRDADFLSALELDDLAPTLAQFWPKKGPCWDALGRMQPQTGARPAPLSLSRRKVICPKCMGPGCQASSPRSLALIEESLTQTKRWLSVATSHDWTGKLYQYANRLAHLYFLREVADVDAWLVNICFLNDPHSPTRSDEWSVDCAKLNRKWGWSVPFHTPWMCSCPQVIVQNCLQHRHDFAIQEVPVQITAKQRVSSEDGYAEASHAQWQGPQDILDHYRSADILPDNRVVFNIKGKQYRLVVKIHYNTGVVYIRFIGTHAEYNQIDTETI